MGDAVVICISSDDEDKPVTPQDKTAVIQKDPNKNSEVFGVGDTVAVKRTSTQVEHFLETPSKRKCVQLSEENSDVPCKRSESYSNDEEYVPILAEPSITECNTFDNTNGQTELNESLTAPVVEKPKLVEKMRCSIPPVEQHPFPMFISLCLQKDRSTDMITIVNKLKTRYEQLDPTYIKSDAFIDFINKKRDAMMNTNTEGYIHIADVMNEMKASRQGKSQLQMNGSGKNDIEDVKNKNGKRPLSHDLSETDDAETSSKRTKNIAKIEKAMADCQKRIEKLENEEVDFDDEENSNYMKVEAYKGRMVDLFNAWCKLTGESTDAGRVYLRPKHLTPTGISAVDIAISNFINAKVAKRNKLKKRKVDVNTVIFPDYIDILQCITSCNETQKLGLTDKKQQQLAKKAFQDLGQYLQRVRHNDYWDTFSYFLKEDEEDPAVKDQNLALKLSENRKEADKRLADVFQKYVEKQEALKNIDKETTADEETDEDNSESDESSNEDDSEFIDNTDEGTDKQSDRNLHKNVNNVYTTKDTKINSDRDTVEVDGKRELIELCPKASSKEPSQNMKNKEYRNNTVPLETVNENETVKKKDSCINRLSPPPNIITISSSGSEEQNSADTETDSVTNLTLNNDGQMQPAQEKRMKEIADVISEGKELCNSKNNDHNGDNYRMEIADEEKNDKQVHQERMNESIDKQKLDQGNATDNIQQKEIGKGSNDTNTKKEEEIKDDRNDPSTQKRELDQENNSGNIQKQPLLRLRSFAKPPTTWVDVHQKNIKSEKLGKQNNAKETEIVDLTGSAAIIEPKTLRVNCNVNPMANGHRTFLLARVNNGADAKQITNRSIKVTPGANSELGRLLGHNVVEVHPLNAATLQKVTGHVYDIRIPTKPNELLVLQKINPKSAAPPTTNFQ